ncbi:MAG: 5-formyltetrahydrofolate cyclo-ligase [Sphingobacteriia bacterium]|nr:5-formyltetrahydrofolate cyclo-ligase [Sphingobacteriia bacterium]NCC39254.1 5-formyltetrahydrofolate cyclo-ligase [Gammaproteobacteria bacterium]
MIGSRALRLALRRARRALPAPTQRHHAEQVRRRLRRDLIYRSKHHIAAYWPADGELDPRPLMREAITHGQALYLPVLGRRFGDPNGKGLRFARYRPEAPMRPNRYGIPEPRGRVRRSARRLDILLVPLVGFDADCNRIGMGGGYYDRTLGYLLSRRHWRRPRLIGIAHECQRLERILPRPWDIPLDAIVTEERVYRRRPAAGAPTPPAPESDR